MSSISRSSSRSISRSRYNTNNKNTMYSTAYNYSKYPHIYSYQYGWINKIIHFILNAFVIKTKIPFLSIILFITVVILNSVQYNNNNIGIVQYNINTYLQDKIKNSVSPGNSFNNIILYFYELVGINGFTMNGLSHVIILIITYICLALIEMNIGHITVILFLIILLMFCSFESSFSSAICDNILTDSSSIGTSSYCCGSFTLFASIGFVLFIIQKHITGLYSKLFIWFIILCVWTGCILYENYDTYKDIPDIKVKNCKLFFWHAMNFVLGLFCALALSN